MRDALVRVEPKELRGSLHAQVKAVHRRKTPEPVGLPFGLLVMDGKGSTSTRWDRTYAQKQEHSEGFGASGPVRTVTCPPGRSPPESSGRQPRLVVAT